MPSLFDTLESRQLFAVAPPTPMEQYLIELINLARRDSNAAAAAIGVDLNEGLSANTINNSIRQPLALSGELTDAAQRQAAFLRLSGTVSPVGPGGNLPAQRLTEAGYPTGGTVQSFTEALTSVVGGPATPGGGAGGAITLADVQQIFRNLIVDAATTGRTNRVALFNNNFREVGAGLASGPFGTTTPGGGGGGGGANQQATIGVVNFARTNGNPAGDLFLTGVAYNDADANQFYTPGEGLGGVVVSARRLSDNQVFTTLTFPSGGYSLRVPTGTYDVIAEGGGLGLGAVRYTAVVIGGGSGSADDRNVKRDFTLQQAGTPPPQPGPTLPPGDNPVTLKGDLVGKVVYDRRGDGRRQNLRFSNVVVGTRIYLDANNDGTRNTNETFGVVLDNGTYNIPGISPGIYTLRVEPPNGFRVSVPNETFRRVQVTSGKLTRVNSFAITERTVISGRVYRDDNINGQFDPQIDRGLRDFRVYLDLNNDGIWQRETEPARKSGSDGQYAFRDLLAGTYTIRAIPRVAYIQTQPPGNGSYVVQLPSNGLNVINRDFGQRLIG